MYVIRCFLAFTFSTLILIPHSEATPSALPWQWHRCCWTLHQVWGHFRPRNNDQSVTSSVRFVRQALLFRYELGRPAVIASIAKLIGTQPAVLLANSPDYFPLQHKRNNDFFTDFTERSQAISFYGLILRGSLKHPESVETFCAEFPSWIRAGRYITASSQSQHSLKRAVIHVFDGTITMKISARPERIRFVLRAQSRITPERFQELSRYLEVNQAPGSSF